MKRNIIGIIIVLAISATFNSCKDDFDTGGAGPYAITGHLYIDCNMQPMANQPIELFQEYNTTFSGLEGGLLAATTTDASGYFKFEFNDLNGLTETIRIPAGAGYRDLFEMIPNHKSYSDLTVFRYPTTNIYVSLIANNSMTSNDTLEITDFRNLTQKLKVPGPFSSGLIYAAENFQTLIMQLGPIQTSYGYRINNGPWTVEDIPMPYCDSTNIIVEIN